VPEVLETVLAAHRVERVESFEQLRDVDAWAREAARRAVGQPAHPGHPGHPARPGRPGRPGRAGS
jgi:hypothetical protein